MVIWAKLSVTVSAGNHRLLLKILKLEGGKSQTNQAGLALIILQNSILFL